MNQTATILFACAITLIGLIIAFTCRRLRMRAEEIDSAGGDLALVVLDELLPMLESGELSPEHYVPEIAHLLDLHQAPLAVRRAAERYLVLNLASCGLEKKALRWLKAHCKDTARAKRMRRGGGRK